jgi:hypothetical protein
VSENAVAVAGRALQDGVGSLRAAADSTVSEDPRIAALSVCESVSRQLERVQVEVVAGLVLLEPQVWAAAEERLAEQARSYRPSELAVFALNLITRWIRTGPVSGSAGQRPARVRPHREGERPARRADPGTVVHRPACVVDAPRRGGRPLRRAPPRGRVGRDLSAGAGLRGPAPVRWGAPAPERDHRVGGVGAADPRSIAISGRRCIRRICGGAGLRCPGAADRDERRPGSRWMWAGRGGRSPTGEPSGGSARPRLRAAGLWPAGVLVRAAPHHFVGRRWGVRQHNCVMSCRFHHRLLHRDFGWLVRIRNGLPEFIPPKWIDQTQAARRKPPPPITICA